MLNLRILATSLVLLLAACASGPPKRINPPQVAIQRLTTQANGAFEVELRLENQSDIAMRFASVDLAFRIAGIDAGRLTTQPDLEVASHSAETVILQLAAGADAHAPLAAAQVNTTAVHYMLRGKVVISEPKRDYDIQFESRLSPVPGKPGEFR